LDESSLDSHQAFIDALADERIGGRYLVKRILGKGGMGTVFEAQDERLERRVAIKILRNELFQDGEGLMRFEREARAVAGIDHPGVIKMYDSGDLSDGSAFLVMELLDGATLKDVLARDGRGTPRQVASLVRQGASALEAAHRAGILHRDVKPENFVCAPGEAGTFTVKLLDFGVAKTMEIESGVTRAGTVLGTPRYMSPEQVQDKPLDSRSDLYSFAVVAYEALTGVPVVADGALPRVMMDVAVKAPVPVSHHLKSLPKSVVAAFASALEKDADRRPATLHGWAATFVDDLEQLPADVPGWRFFRGDVDEGASTEPHIPALRRR
jgi:serine/threonine protein kinase